MTQRLWESIIMKRKYKISQMNNKTRMKNKTTNLILWNIFKNLKLVHNNLIINRKNKINKYNNKINNISRKVSNFATKNFNKYRYLSIIKWTSR